MIFVLDDIHVFELYREYWGNAIPQSLLDAGEDVHVVSPTVPVFTRDDVLAQEFYKAKQYHELYKLIVQGDVQNGDIIIFSDAWNPSVASIRNILMDIDLDVKLVGYWFNSIAISNSKAANRYRKEHRVVVKAEERMMHAAYDLSCFPFEYAMTRFKDTYRMRSMKKLVHTTIPAGYMGMVPGEHSFEKEDLILVLHHGSTDDYANLGLALQNEFDEIFEVVNLVDDSVGGEAVNMLMSRAKGVFYYDNRFSDPLPLYHAMLYGCVPIVPDRLFFPDVVDKKYLYDSVVTEAPTINFIRHFDALESKVSDIISNYSRWSDVLVEDVKKLHDKQFCTEKFLTDIKEKLYV